MAGQNAAPLLKVEGLKQYFRVSKSYTVKAVDNVNVASQTDVYDRLDVHDGYEILVAGTEDINYNVKYKTDHNDSAKDAEDSKVT